MRRKIAALVTTALLAGGVIAANLAPAEATHTYRHLVRQINRLENQVEDLRNEVYRCEKWIGVSQYGDLSTEGYTYRYSDGTSSMFETALDLDDSNNPQYKVLTYEC
jgi:HEPN domain-containing protein